MTETTLRCDCGEGEVIIKIDQENGVITIMGAKKLTSIYHVTESGKFSQNTPADIEDLVDRGLAITIDNRQGQGKAISVVVKNNEPENYNAFFEQFPGLEITAIGRPEKFYAFVAGKKISDEKRDIGLGKVDNIM